MPVRAIGPNVFERTPLNPGSTDYVASPALVEDLRRWYETTYPYEQMERPQIEIEHPEGFRTIKRSSGDGRTILTLWNPVTDACVQVSFREASHEKTDFQVQALPPEEAYELALERDERDRAPNYVIYNARHPRP